MHVCHCTNQCKGCGSCCQFCQGQCGYTRQRSAPVFVPIAPQFLPQHPLTEEGLRRILREAMDEALEEIRKLKGDDA